jgi:hypothetical integral membrane protein (TIGR02206 family)
VFIAAGADDGHVADHVAYWTCVAVAAVLCVCACIAARHRPGRWTTAARYAIGVVLGAAAVNFVAHPILAGDWTARSSLPLALCDAALFIAALACVRPGLRLAVELTWFWGLAGTLQAVATPDLSVGFPHLEFWDFVLGHVGIVFAALFLVVGLGLHPRRGAVVRVFAVTVGYTAFVGCVDAATGGNYMFLRAIPSHVSLLSVLGPWPWYLVSAAAVALVLLALLDAPFRHSEEASAARAPSGRAEPATATSRRSRSATRS